MASRCGLLRSCLAMAVRSFSARVMLRSRKADSCCSSRCRMCRACFLHCCLRCLRDEGSNGPKAVPSGGSGCGSVSAKTDRAEKLLCVLIVVSRESACLILLVVFPLTSIQSSLRPPPRHSLSNLYAGTKGISMISVQIRRGRYTFNSLLK